jgi:hypothetical protein
MPNDNTGDFNKMPYEKIAEDSRYAYDGDGDTRLSQFRMPDRMPDGMRGFDGTRGFDGMRGFDETRGFDGMRDFRDRDQHIHHHHHFDRGLEDLFPFFFLR